LFVRLDRLFQLKLHVIQLSSQLRLSVGGGIPSAHL